MNKQIITASVCLLASLTIAGITGKNFMDVKKPDELRPGPGVTQTKMLSDYFPDIAGTNADSTVYGGGAAGRKDARSGRYPCE